MFNPEVWRERMVGDGSYDAIFQSVAWLEAEDAHGFDADVLIGGRVHYGGIRMIGDGAWQDVHGAAARMDNMHDRDFHRFERAVEVEVELRELADAEFAIDFHQCVNFFAAVAVCLESYFSFEQCDLRRMGSFL